MRAGVVNQKMFKNLVSCPRGSDFKIEDDLEDGYGDKDDDEDSRDNNCGEWDV